MRKYTSKCLGSEQDKNETWTKWTMKTLLERSWSAEYRYATVNIPAPQECPLNLEPKALLKVYRKATQCDTNMGKTFWKALDFFLWPLPNHLLALLGRVKTKFHLINNSKNEIWPNKCAPQSLKHIIHLRSSLTHFHIIGKTLTKHFRTTKNMAKKHGAAHFSVLHFPNVCSFFIHFPG